MDSYQDSVQIGSVDQDSINLDPQEYIRPGQSKNRSKYLVANATLFGYLFHTVYRYRYNMEVDEEKIDTYNI
jgi:hypothetical protein